MAASQESVLLSDLAVDDFYFSLLFDEKNEENIFSVSDARYAEELQAQEALLASTIATQMTKSSSSSSLTIKENIFLVSDVKYAEELQSQEALMASTIATQMTKSSSSSSLTIKENILSVSDAKYAEELQSEEALMASTVATQMAKSSSSSSLTINENTVPKPEAGESSLSFCEICAERKERDQMFKIESCSHSFCSDCISNYVATKIQDGITTVTCPDLHCKSILEYDACKSLLPEEVELWDEALSEELFDASQRFYCPFKDCSGLLVNDNKGEVIRESECPFCHRLFCAVCYIPWHPGVDCEEFQRMNADDRGREDLMFRKLAKEKKWSRCPHCKFYVERTRGCPHMTCRCNFQFCYECGSEWTANHSWVHR